MVCYTDSTIALPLMTAYALQNAAPRPLRRLYDRRDELMDNLTHAYLDADRPDDAQWGNKV